MAQSGEQLSDVCQDDSETHVSHSFSYLCLSNGKAVMLQSQDPMSFGVAGKCGMLSPQVWLSGVLIFPALVGLVR